jgi:hypothetical protein
MDRRAADNPYLHKDFHGALSAGIQYLHEHYGEEAVRDYLWEFTTTYYAPVTVALRERGLEALREHFECIYDIEGADVEISLADEELTLRVPACPAVTHMREHGYPVAELFVETDRTVHAALCSGTPFAAELLEYDPATGRSLTRFYRRPA